jgi:hypothetical protein
MRADVHKECTTCATCQLTKRTKKKYGHLGMTIDWTTSKKVVFSMFDLVQTIIEQLPKNVSTGPDVTPAANHLFQVKENGEKLSSEDADLFHRLTAQLLNLGKRARPDLQTPAYRAPTWTIFANWDE